MIGYVIITLALIHIESAHAAGQDHHYDHHRMLNSRGIDYPSYRYIQYEFLNKVTKDIVTDSSALNYTEETWNIPGTADIEKLSFESIGLLDDDADDGSTLKIESLESLGFTEETYDCYINHYYDYDWDELDESDANVMSYYETLGWTEESWAFDNPDTDYKSWDELSTDEQEAAIVLGFNEDNWEDDDFVPESDDYDWDEMNNKETTAWTTLGYSEEKWDNYIELPDIEGKLWDELTSDEIDAAKELCFFNEEIWNKASLIEWTTAPPTTATPIQEITTAPTMQPSIKDKTTIAPSASPMQTLVPVTPTSNPSSKEEAPTTTTDQPTTLDEEKSSFSFGECQGDCRNDNDCIGDLVCINLGLVGDEIVTIDDVPGCGTTATTRTLQAVCYLPPQQPPPTPPTTVAPPAETTAEPTVSPPSPSTPSSGGASLMISYAITSSVLLVITLVPFFA